MVLDLRSTRLAFLWDHIVAGRPILPGAAMLEVASTAARTLVLDGAAADGWAPAVVEAAIPAPVLLTAAGSAQLRCAVAMRSGRLELQASTGTGKPSQTIIVSIRCALRGRVYTNHVLPRC